MSVMGRRRREEEINEAADRFVEAVKELTRSVNRISEREERVEQLLHHSELLLEKGRPREDEQLPPGWKVVRYYLPPHLEPTSEEVASQIAHDAVREVREDLWADRIPEAPAPSPEEIEAWSERREARRRRGTGADFDISF